MGFKWIDIYVDGLVEHCYSDNVYEIYKFLDIKIVKVSSDDYVLRGNESFYVRNYFGIEAVFIKDDLPYLFEKFVLSHELGHAILHTNLKEAAYNKELIVRGKLERQADYFAMKLLDVNIDKVFCQGLTANQIASDLFITKDSLEIYL